MNTHQHPALFLKIWTGKIGIHAQVKSQVFIISSSQLWWKHNTRVDALIVALLSSDQADRSIGTEFERQT